MNTKHFRRVVLGAALLIGPLAIGHADVDLQKKVDSLSTELEQLKSKLNSGSSATEASSDRLGWLSVSGDMRVRHDSVQAHAAGYTNVSFSAAGAPVFTASPEQTVRNDSLWTTRFGLNLGAQVAESVSLKSRLVMVKAFGSTSGTPFLGSYFADRTQVFDGNVGHVPDGNTLFVDYAYFDITNIMDYPVWFSGGRRPSTGGVPTRYRRNEEYSGIAGTMGLLTDYAFDGFTLGMAPDYVKLPGLSAKLCYGRAYQTAYQTSASSPYLQNTDMLGVMFLPYETEDTRFDFQFQHGFHVMDNIPGPNVSANVGDLENYGIGGSHAVRKAGPGDLNFFLYGAVSRSLPNSTLSHGMAGLEYDAGQNPDSHLGGALYTGIRYDVTKSRTKIGLEYNRGSKYWINFTPASDDVWTSKLGTRGSVYEAYVIQELFRPAVSPKGLVDIRVGYQYYNFDYTGSNNWMGAPIKMSDVSASTGQMLSPVRNAYDIYTMVDVHF